MHVLNVGRNKSASKWGGQIMGMNFQTCSGTTFFKYSYFNNAVFISISRKNIIKLNSGVIPGIEC